MAGNGRFEHPYFCEKIWENRWTNNWTKCFEGWLWPGLPKLQYHQYPSFTDNSTIFLWRAICFRCFLFSSLDLWLLWLLWVCGFCGFTMLYLSSHLSVYLSNLTSSNQTKPNLILSNIISFYMVLSCFIFPI